MHAVPLDALGRIEATRDRCGVGHRCGLLIVRRRDPADRRRHIVELSAAGAGELCLAQARLSRVEDDLLAVLSAAERATLYRLLARAVDAVAGGKQAACVRQAAVCAGDELAACAGDEPTIC